MIDLIAIICNRKGLGSAKHLKTILRCYGWCPLHHRHLIIQIVADMHMISKYLQNKIKNKHKIWEEQDQVAGVRRDDEIVTNFPEAAAMGRILMNVGFPADKNKIIQFVQKQQESNPECRFDCKEILPLLQKIEERHYENAFEVTRAAGLVRSVR